MSYRYDNGMGGWKAAFTVLLLLAFVLTTVLIYQEVFSNYTFEKKYAQLWELSDKSSTITAKQQYINGFVSSLRKGQTNGEFATHDAVFLKTPNNEFDSNVRAVETLAKRLTEIQDMNPSSFEYNTAIQQITAQEQGEAHRLMGVIKGCYTLENYPMVWNWYGGFLLFLTIILWISAVICAAIGWDWSL
jgi:hypothetical protein